MRTASFVLFIILVIFVSVFIGMITYYSYHPPTADLSPQTASSTPPVQLQKPIVTRADPIRGNPNAKTKIVEFGDFFCAACFDMETILKEIIEKQEISLVWKDLPNSNVHPLAQKASEAARCAQEQGKFWEYHDLLFANQGTLTENMLYEFATNLGLNVDLFTTCLQSGRSSALITRTLNEALLLNVDATPYFFVGEQRFVGAISKEQIQKLISPKL